MEVPQGCHPQDGENQLRLCTSSSSEQDDRVQVIANILLSKYLALTTFEVDICFKAAKAAVRYMD